MRWESGVWGRDVRPVGRVAKPGKTDVGWRWVSFQIQQAACRHLWEAMPGTGQVTHPGRNIAVLRLTCAAGECCHCVPCALSFMRFDPCGGVRRPKRFTAAGGSGRREQAKRANQSGWLRALLAHGCSRRQGARRVALQRALSSLLGGHHGHLGVGRGAFRSAHRSVCVCLLHGGTFKTELTQHTRAALGPQ
jgi:hypothetical protein